MRYFITGSLLVVAVIHLLPLSGVIGSERLAALYGISFDESNVEILMRHRAVLFGLLGSFLFYAAFKPSLQLLAFIAGLVSVVSFMWLAWSIGGYNAEIERVFFADLVALVCLLAGITAYVISRKRHENQLKEEHDIA